MRIELRGIINSWNSGHRQTEIVVTEDRPDNYKSHSLGVDIKVNRGKIRTFLASLYNIRPSEIVWPEHIRIQGE